MWLFFLMLANIPSLVQSQFCRRFNSTWEGFIDVVQSIETSSGYDVLCSFEISGVDCPSPNEFPLGYQIRRSLILICDPDLFGYQDESECIIKCPGIHFSLEESASLTLDGFTLAGATNSSIHLQEQATLRMINSNMRENYAGDNNGGAIRAMGQNSMVEVEYSKFSNNEGLIGGAIYTVGNLRILQTIFTDNIAPAAGGAIASLPSGDIDIQRSSFHGNQAATGGALYMLRVVASLLSSTFTNNYAIDGGAVYNGARSSIDESVFMDNYAENGGGAINCEVGSFTTINRSEFINNNAGNIGPAVHDRFNTRVVKTDNTACGNAVTTRNSDCDGVLIRLNRRRAKCLPFADICIPPTPEPSALPSSIPSTSQSPSSPFPSAQPTNQPSSSSVPSGQPTVIPTSPPSWAPSEAPSSSSAPSDFPSLTPSSLPSLSMVPSSHPSQHPSTSPSSSTAPSLSPSTNPSSIPSETPSKAPTSSIAPSTQPSLSVEPTSSTAPSLSPSTNPSSIPSETPSKAPTSSIAPSTQPSFSVEPTSSMAPSDPPSTQPTSKPSRVPTTAPTSNAIQSHSPTISDINDLTDFNSIETSAPSSSAGTPQHQRRRIETASHHKDNSNTGQFTTILQLRRRLNN